MTTEVFSDYFNSSHQVSGLLGFQQSKERKQSTDQHSEISARDFHLDGDRSNELFREDSRRSTHASISKLLSEANYRGAIVALESAYSSLTREEIDEVKTLLLRTADTLASKQDYAAATELLSSYTESFDELAGWQKLGYSAAKTQDWQLALSSQIRALQLETTNQGFAASLKRLNLAARSVRADYERANDFTSIVWLYENLNSKFPEQAKFQLDLAQAYLRMSNFSSAERLLTGLQYDPEFGEIALQLLAKLQNANNIDTASTSAQQLTRDDLSVPLRRLGSSLVAPVSISGVRLSLLLDTGASITALTPSTIRRLGLEATGQSITLSTANGVRQAPLFHADEVRLGRLLYSDVIIAEVELDPRGRVQGLLGTDLLSRSNDRYSYLIDDQHNALIFRAR